jgi:hypothetical protein
MKTFYHGSPIPNMDVLEPRLDPRLGIEGLFVADEPFGPMMFALLPIRSGAIVNYKTKDGEFIEGKVITPHINKEGWLYTIEAEDGIIQEIASGQYMLTSPVKIAEVKKVLKKEILKIGWEVEITQPE